MHWLQLLTKVTTSDFCHGACKHVTPLCVTNHCWKVRPCSASALSSRVPCCLQTGSCLQRFLQPEGTKLGMCMAVVFCQLPRDAAGGLHLLAAYEGGHVVLWDAKQPLAPIASIRGHEEPVMALALQPSGNGERSHCCHGHEWLWLLERSYSPAAAR